MRTTGFGSGSCHLIVCCLGCFGRLLCPSDVSEDGFYQLVYDVLLRWNVWLPGRLPRLIVLLCCVLYIVLFCMLCIVLWRVGRLLT